MATGVHKKREEKLTLPLKYELHRSTKTGELMNSFLSKFMMYYEIKQGLIMDAQSSTGK